MFQGRALSYREPNALRDLVARYGFQVRVEVISFKKVKKLVGNLIPSYEKLKATNKYLGIVEVEGTSSTPARGMADSQSPVDSGQKSGEHGLEARRGAKLT